jgi:hypothetical protein
MVWLVVILISLIALAAVVLLAQQLREGGQATGPEIQMTPIVGGMAAAPTTQPVDGEPQVTATQAATPTPSMVEPAVGTTQTGVLTDSVEVAVAENAAGTDGEPDVVDAPTGFAVGAVVMAGADPLVLRAMADAEAPAMDSLAAGAELVVMEPTGDFETYPADVNGEAWVRLRAADGLVGWARVDDLVVVE